VSVRDWVVEKLREDHRVVEPVGEHGVRVTRRGRPDAFGYCVEPDLDAPFTVGDIEDALRELPETGMVIITRRLVDPEVYSQARNLGICVDTFGGFVRALEIDDISRYVHPEETYVRRRLFATRAVASVDRLGHRAWIVERVDRLRPLVIVTHDRYELTDDDFAMILSEYPKLDLDALVVTNPSAQGFGNRVVQSAQQAAVPLYTFHDFLRRIREPWT
jgi:hypothetical protein